MHACMHVQPTITLVSSIVYSMCIYSHAILLCNQIILYVKCERVNVVYIYIYICKYRCYLLINYIYPHACCAPNFTFTFYIHGASQFSQDLVIWE
jgi:hypothetical protein